MEVENTLRMNAGDGQNSYANNSHTQQMMISKTRAVLEDTIKDLIRESGSSHCYTIADLGCASGPNTFVAVSNMIDSILSLSSSLDKQSPHEFQVYLNDLPGNDFNSIFKFAPAFYEKYRSMGQSCFICGVPGSFYQRLFPANSLNLVYSSASLHWLSQVPPGIKGNKRSIFISNSSPHSVYLAYLEQFHRDFSTFLSLRRKEMVTGGRMILILNGRSTADTDNPYASDHWQLVADTLLEMAAEGLVKETDIESFNIPFYSPYKDEVIKVIEEEGSFNIHRLEPTDIAVGGEQTPGVDATKKAQRIALSVRAFLEPLLASHFGDAIMDDLFTRWAKQVPNYDSILNGKITVLAVSLATKSSTLT